MPKNVNSIIEYCGSRNFSKCGYCKQSDKRHSYGKWCREGLYSMHGNVLFLFMNLTFFCFMMENYWRLREILFHINIQWYLCIMSILPKIYAYNVIDWLDWTLSVCAMCVVCVCVCLCWWSYAKFAHTMNCCLYEYICIYIHHSEVYFLILDSCPYTNICVNKSTSHTTKAKVYT